MNYKRVIYILLIGTITLLASCSDNRHDDNSWFKPIDDFVAEHQQLMQSHPDSMAMLIRRLQCNERPELSDQWKRLIIAKCYFLKGADAECQNLIDSVNDFCRQHPNSQYSYKIQSYADNLQGVLLQAIGQRDSALTYYIKAYNAIMNLSNHDEAIDICINAADASRQLGKLANA